LHKGGRWLLLQDNGDTSGVVKLWNSDGTEVSITGPTVATGEWWFYAYTIDSGGNTLKLYWAEVGVDQSLSSGNVAYRSIYADSPDFYVGNTAVDNEELQGDVAFLKIWTKELTQQELLLEFFSGPRVVDHDNLWGHYLGGPFATIDFSGNNRNLSQTGSTSQAANPPLPAAFDYWDEEDSVETDLSPTGLTLTEIAGPKVTISFTDQTGGLRQHRIFRKTTGAYIPIATLDPGDTDWDDATVSQHTNYTYQVCVLDVGQVTSFCTSASILVGRSGTGALTYPALTASGTGEVVGAMSGTGALVYPALTASGTGEVDVSGTGAVTYPALQASGTGAADPILGTGAITYPALIASGEGFVSAVSGIQGTVTRRRWRPLHQTTDLASLIATINRHMQDFDLRAGESEVGEIVEINSNFSPGGFNRTILVDATAGSVAVTLLPASKFRRKILSVKKIDSSANTVTVTPNGTEEIDGASSKVLTSQYDKVTIHSDGANWWEL
jgi:hypothetical protein